MDTDMAGFIGLAVLMAALSVWLRADMHRHTGRLEARANERMDRLEAGRSEVRERLAQTAGMVDGLREAVVATARLNAV